MILVISLCFNVFFAWGFLASRYVLKRLKTPEGRIELVAKKLDLSQQQKESFIRLHAGLQDQAKKIIKLYSVDINAYWQEVIKDNPDSLKVKQALERASQGKKEFMFLATDHIIKLMRTLKPEQRETYVKILRKDKFLNK